MVKHFQKTCAALILWFSLIILAMVGLPDAHSSTIPRFTPDAASTEISDWMASSEAMEDAVTEFVTRFYRECLDREPDPEGLAGWVNGMKNGWVTGGELAEGFILSPEFINMNVSDETFLTILYRAFFDRQPDLEGFNGWLSALGQGMSRASVLEGFIRSSEFAELCRRYGIPPYRMDRIEAFVTRFYHECLNRAPDPSGLAGWVNGLKNGWVTGGELARGFILSPEFTSRDVSNEAFLTILYEAFFDRVPDTVGFNGWLSALEKGMSRAAVLESFIRSEEFAALCAGYGIIAVRGGTEPPGACADISGEWQMTQTLTISCCAEGYCETETESISETGYIDQDGCTIDYAYYEPGFGGGTLVGTIDGNDIRMTLNLISDDPDISFYENTIDFRGTVQGNRIDINGSGRLRGGSQGVTVVCDVTTTLVLTRSTMASLSDVEPDDASVGPLPSTFFRRGMEIIQAIGH
ncbi:DUF4214 domain-containing protein [Desulfococcus sp.]|uniref:DUF4214 domain-containing protein n=1 Tax=Desulfococcus sp. TaxID=2025834 RepID=UPI003593E9E4